MNNDIDSGQESAEKGLLAGPERWAELQKQQTLWILGSGDEIV